MSNQIKEKKILVIGSKGHKLANRCVLWKEIFPYLGDYDLIIINLQSLSGSILDSISEKLEEMRADINEIVWANTEVVCITAPPKISGGFLSGLPLRSNYHWCPIYPFFEQRKGESFEEERSGYFKFVNQWTHFLRNFSSNPYRVQRREEFNFKIKSLLKNKARKHLAFELFFIEWNLGAPRYGRREKKDFITSNSILFLPPPTEISIEEAVDFLLKDARGVSETEKYTLPEWANNVEIQNERLIKKAVEEKTELLKKAQKDIKGLQEKLSPILKYKLLLTEGGEGMAGDRLEDIVEESLRLIGIQVKPGPKKKEDRIITDPETAEKIPLEITGCVKSIPERKLNQLIGRLTDKRRPQEIKCRGVLVGNHYKDVPLNNRLKGRKAPFESDVIKKAEIFDVCLLPTIELFKAVNVKLKNGDVSEFAKKIFNQKGVLNFNRT